MYRDRQLIRTALVQAIDSGLDDQHLIDEARQLIHADPTADVLAKTDRVLRQLRMYVRSVQQS